MTTARPPVAIVHDYLTQRGGAERVVLAMTRAFPGAPVHTSLYEPADTYPELAGVDIRTTPANRVGVLRRHHRLGFPLYAPLFGAMTVDADVVVCSSSGWAHGVRTTGRRVVYCHAPARWLYQPDNYANGRRSLTTLLRLAGPPLRAWDRRAARRADRYVANSTVVARAIGEHYGIEAEVLPPPVSISVDGPDEPVPGVEPGALLCVSRLLGYKNVDAVVGAFTRLPDLRLVLVGDGPEGDRLRSVAPANVRLAGTVSEAQLRWCYRNAAGLIGASFEDFGLTPLEAAAFGRPAAVLAAGGYLDTVRDGETGVTFDAPDPDRIADGVRRMLATDWDDDVLRAHAREFSEASFAARLRAIVDEVRG